jgi:hypothetical protein
MARERVFYYQKYYFEIFKKERERENKCKVL